jgi:hypothetical protein
VLQVQQAFPDFTLEKCMVAAKASQNLEVYDLK